jgi:hypothetical protein
MATIRAILQEHAYLCIHRRRYGNQVSKSSEYFLKHSILTRGPKSPLLSMISSMHDTGAMPEEVHFLFGYRVNGNYDVSNVLGLGKLLEISDARPGQFHLYLFLCGHPSRALMETAIPRRRFEPRQVLDSDVIGAFGNEQSKESSVCYISAPQLMTDHFEELVRIQVGLENGQVRVNSTPDDPAQKPLWGDGSSRVFA